METFIDIIIENYPIIGIAFLCGWGISRFYNRYKNLEKRVEALPCKERGKDISNLKHKVAILQANTKEMRQAPTSSRKASPLKLNDVGERVFADCNGEEFIQRHKDLLFEWIDDEHPKTALDVEQCALMVLRMYSNEDMFNELKDWVYNSPAIKTEKEGKIEEIIVSLDDLFFIISLPLRDKYLQERWQSPQN